MKQLPLRLGCSQECLASRVDLGVEPDHLNRCRVSEVRFCGLVDDTAAGADDHAHTFGAHAGLDRGPEHIRLALGLLADPGNEQWHLADDLANECHVREERGSGHERAVPVSVPVVGDVVRHELVEQKCVNVRILELLEHGTGRGVVHARELFAVHDDLPVLELLGTRVGRLAQPDAAPVFAIEERSIRTSAQVRIERDSISPHLVERVVCVRLVGGADVPELVVQNDWYMSIPRTDVLDERPECSISFWNPQPERDVRLEAEGISCRCLNDFHAKAVQTQGTCFSTDALVDLRKPGIQANTGELARLPASLKHLDEFTHRVSPFWDGLW